MPLCLHRASAHPAAKGAFKKAVILPQFIGQAVASAVQYPVNDHAAEVAEHEVCNPFRAAARRAAALCGQPRPGTGR